MMKMLTVLTQKMDGSAHVRPDTLDPEPNVSILKSA